MFGTVTLLYIILICVHATKILHRLTFSVNSLACTWIPGHFPAPTQHWHMAMAHPGNVVVTLTLIQVTMVTHQ